jgi:hypothetical protein
MSRSRFAVPAFADLSLYYTDKCIETLICAASGFAKTTYILAQRTDLVADCVDLALVDLRN